MARRKMSALKLIVLLMFLVATASAQQRVPAPTGTPQTPPARGSRTRVVRSSSMRVELPSPMAEMPVPFGIPSADGTDALQPLGAVSPDLGFERQVVSG